MLIQSMLLRFFRSVVIFMAEMLDSSVLLYLFFWVHVQWCHVGALIMVVVGLFIWRKLANTTIQDMPPPPFFFLESPLLLNIYNHTLSGMPRNDKEIDTVIFRVICLVLWIIFSHSEGTKQVGDEAATVRKRFEAQRHALAQKQTQNQLRYMEMVTASLALKVIFWRFSFKKIQLCKTVIT